MTENQEKIKGIKRYIRFFEHDIWHLQITNNKPVKFLLDSLRVLVYSLQGFVRDDVQLRASALTFYSLLSIVPLLAMAFGIAKGFQLEKQFEERLMENFSGQAEVIDQSLVFAQQLLDNTQGGIVAGVGILVLIYSVIRLFSNIEQSFNSIWDIKKERSIVRKLTDYLALVLLAPVFLVGASSLTIQIAQTVQDFIPSVGFLSFLERIFLPLLKLLPYTVIWIFFTLMYMIMPNTNVKFKSAFIAAIVAGSTYQIVQWGLINFQVGVAKYNAIYGSFAALPLFLFWLQLSWLIFLFGGEMAFSHQNVKDYQKEVSEKELSLNARREALIVLMRHIVKRFIAGEKAHNFETIASTLNLPVKICHALLEELTSAGILNRTEDAEGDISAYIPATDPAKLTISYILDSVDKFGQNRIWSEEDFKFSEIGNVMDNLRKERGEASGAIAVKDL